MTNAKRIRYILSELKQNELYLNKVFPKNNGFALLYTLNDNVIQERFLETFDTKELEVLFTLMITEKAKHVLKMYGYNLPYDEFFTGAEWRKLLNTILK